MNDLMRLPLGILTGVGFIGGGAILRRGNFVIGVTTAATLWYVTVIGLCFGGGQLLLGWIATIIGGLVLWCGGWVESKLPVEREAKLSIAVDQSGPIEDVLLSEIRAGGLHVSDLASSHVGASREFAYIVSEMAKPGASRLLPTLVAKLKKQSGVCSVHWETLK